MGRMRANARVQAAVLKRRSLDMSSEPVATKTILRFIPETAVTIGREPRCHMLQHFAAAGRLS